MPAQELASDSGVHAPVAAGPAKVQAEATERTPITREFSWAEVKEVVAAGQLDRLGRTAAAEAAYAEDMRRIREEHGSVVAYIRGVKLADFVADLEAEYLLIPNDYPYALASDTAHYIVWSKTKLASGTVPDPAVRGVVAARLDALLGAGAYEWVWFVNPMHLQSIPEFVHGHLLVRTL
ncbi:hypothetical protein H4R19_000489 [Coemansia spiralis]|nr:hypothetical protein H4R19_000489 [Coemansia spiralis]